MADDVKIVLSDLENDSNVSAAQLKCCKEKSSKLKFCINCHKFWHISCMEDHPEIKLINDNVIACCNITSKIIERD